MYLNALTTKKKRKFKHMYCYLKAKQDECIIFY